MAIQQLPLLDMDDLAAGGERADNFRADLRQATHELGFFQLRHQIPAEVTDQLFAAAREFFALNQDSKDEIAMSNSPRFRGYTSVGGEFTQGVADMREQIDIGSEREPNITEQPAYLRLDGPNQWPSAQPGLRPVILDWIERLSELGTVLLQEWAVSLGSDRHIFDSLFDKPSTLLKLIRYPGQEEDDAQGVGAHKDPGILTLLLIEAGKGGLEVLTDDGWIEVPPAEHDVFVVNIGELMEVATDGYLRATKHRVASPTGTQDRISIPFFFNPSLDAQVPTLELPPQLQAQARGVENDASNVLSSRYGQNLLKARLRAHPDVAATHHADLIDA